MGRPHARFKLLCILFSLFVVGNINFVLFLVILLFHFELYLSRSLVLLLSFAYNYLLEKACSK